MSRRHTSSGSRFQPLHVEGEDEEEDDVFGSSTEEMNLSRDFYPANIAGAMRSSGSRSPIGGATSSRRLYQTGTPISHGGARRQSFRSADWSPILGQRSSPALSSITRPSIGSQRYVSQRSPRSTPVLTHDSSGLQFVWDHYKRDTSLIDDIDPDFSLDILEGYGEGPFQGTFEGTFEYNEPAQISQSSQQEAYSTTCIEEDIPILRGIGFNIDYPNGRLGAGFYGVVYRGYYGTGVRNFMGL